AWDCEELSFNECLERYRKADQDHKDSDVLVEWGVGLSIMGDGKAAIEKYKKATEINPKYSLAHYGWGYVLEQLGKYPEAAQKYKDVVKLDPDDIYAYEGWVIVSEAMLKGEKNGDEAKRIKGELAQAYEEWGRALDKLGRYDEATEKYKKADELGGGFSQSNTFDIGGRSANPKVNGTP
ncbi:MAG TPA: tetratricopeptide repeat protein, partial [Thermodesulfobacteriota bacterium]|nr:tetratricopeptide repeat protein [Thermodesulfobacteriota bacterium]